ncbi:MAG: hypothetical protein MUP27_09070 [Desulfobacterales bacterium]|nr:hypothetical protein [Desulfobacterales bacterium]
MMNDLFRVIPISSKSAQEWILKKHYARRQAPVSYAFALVENETGELRGIMTVGSPPNKNLGAFICGDKYKDYILEFNRLCIDVVDRRNVASWFCTQALKLIPKPLILVSYADENQGHVGYIYQALNWIYTGEGSIGTKMFVLKDGTKRTQRTVTGVDRREAYEGLVSEKIDLKPKHRYIYFHGDRRWVREAKKYLRLSVLPYPKGDSEHYDVSGEGVKKTILGFGLIKFQLPKRARGGEKDENKEDRIS